jgi:ribosomal-protein-alanine N-acetyltransferase
MATPQPLQFVIASMSPAAAEAMSTWRYDGPWQIYDLDGRVPQRIDAYRSVLAQTGKGIDLVGFFCVGEEARVPGLDPVDGTLDLGWGMHPSWVGRGHGTAFGAAVLEAARQLHSGTVIRAVVQSWNRRSTRVLAKLGFTQVGTHAGVQGGREVQYVVLVLGVRSAPLVGG